ncbi:MAG: 3-oxoacyl-ACP reductase family protein [Gemmatimonadota bacterium]
MDLSGRVALVTGAARRLGRAIARALAEAGADLALHHHASAELAEEGAEDLRGLGARVEVFQTDLAEVDQIAGLFDEIARSFGGLDILVNNAAIFERTPLLDISPADWDRVLNLNLRAPFFCSQHAARLMMSRGLGGGGGSIVNIADVGGLQPWPGYAHHSIAKAGVIMLTRVLARALAPDIRVNAVAPGPILPPSDVSPEERDELAQRTALKRLGRPEDVAHTVLFLVRSDYVTGETIVVDGGKMLLT